MIEGIILYYLKGNTLMQQHTIRWLLSLPLLLLLAGLFSACDLGGSSSTSTPTPTPAASALTTYKGDGFTIGYPATWKVSTKQGIVTFTDPQGVASLYVKAVPNPNGLLPSDVIVQGGLQVFKARAKNYQAMPLPSSTTVAGDTWSEGAATGNLEINGQTINVQTVVIADNHPAKSASTKAYTIVYATGSQVFDLANQGYFQPMLQSFQFA